MFGNKKLMGLVSLLVIAITILSACATPTPQVVEKEVVVEKPVVQTVVVEKEVVVEKPVVQTVLVEAAGYPEQIITGSLGDVPKVCPITVRSTDGEWRASMIFDRFVRLDSATLEPTPQLAKHWEISPDGLTYTVEIQQGVRWHDGEPFTVEDVAFTIYMILHPNSASPFQADWATLAGADRYTSGEVETLDSIRIIDDYNIEFTLEEPNATWIAVGWLGFKPMPKHLLEGLDPADLQGDHPFYEQLVGVGPFKFDHWDQGSEFVMVANEDYWKGTVAIKKVIHRIIPDTEALVIGLETGEIDASMYADPRKADILKEKDFLHVVVPPFQSPNGMAFNLNHPVVDDLAVRKAIVHGVDIETYTDRFLLGLGKPGVGPVAPALWAYDSSLERHTYDPSLAEQILDEAGWKMGDDGIREKDGVRASFTLQANAGNALREEFLTFVQNEAKKIGIAVELEFPDWNGLVGNYWSGEFDALCGIGPQAFLEPDELATLMCDDPRNVLGYCNPRVDELLEEGRRVSDIEKRKPLYFEVQGILMEEIPAWWAWYRPFIHVVKKDFVGPWFQPTPWVDGIFWNLGDWGRE